MPDVVCLCDTRLGDEMYSKISNEQNVHCYYSDVQVPARGVCVLIKKSVPIKVLDMHKDNDGNWVVVKLEYDSHLLHLHSVYGPNTDTSSFFHEIFEYISNSVVTDNILVGDFNVTLNTQIDNMNYAHECNPQSRQKLNELLEEFGFFDVFRKLFGDKKNFTWFNRGGRQRARLDMAIASNSLNPFITSYKSLPFYKSDHRPQLLTIDYSSFARGKGYWKFNNSLLNDSEYVKEVKKSINETCSKYFASDIHANFLIEASPDELADFKEKSPEDLQELNYNISPSLMFDMLLNDVRNATISFSTNKKRIENEEEKRLHADIVKYQNIKSLGKDIPNLDPLLEASEQRYKEFLEAKSERQIFRNKVTNAKENERPTAYFCSLERNRSAQRFISRLRVQRNGREILITDQNEIADECRKFYKTLYECRDEEGIVGNLNLFGNVDNVEHPILSEDVALRAEGELTESEILRTLKNTTSDTAPGITGFTYEFYKFFWRDLKGFMLKTANHSYQQEMLPASQRTGIISLLPKGNKPMDLLKNLRPVTLTDAFYKIVSGSVAYRINEVLPELINEQQCGFVKGRYIGECIRTTFDVFDWANRNSKVGLLLLIDFEKAFDSISFVYILKTLKYFGFGESIIKWVRTILYNFQATINLAGNLTVLFNVLRGARQGDPIASPLFVLAIEILCIRLRSSIDIMAFRMERLSVLLSLFADDCSIFLEYDSTNLRNTISILNDFFRVSGLKIQLEKTQCVVFGKLPIGDMRLCRDINLKWDQNFTLLGVDFEPSLENMSVNLQKKMVEIDNVIKNWKNRFLTPLGKCTVVKTLLLSKLSHLAVVLPALNKAFIASLESKIYQFIWKGPDKVKRDDAKMPEMKGGLNMPDIRSSWQSFKISWFKRLLDTKAMWGEIFDLNLAKLMPGHSRVDIATNFGTKELIELQKRFPSKFWSECFVSLKEFLMIFVRHNPQSIINCHIWNSHIFMRNNAMCGKGTFRSIYEKIKFPVDILKFDEREPRFMTYDECDQKYGNINYEQYISLKLVISHALSKHRARMSGISITRPCRPTMFDCIYLSKKGCGKWAKILKNKGSNASIIAKEHDWEISLGGNQGVLFWDNCYRNVKNLFFDNKLKTFYYMTIRGTLKTNRLVYHHVAGLDANCTFCKREIETITHLFWDCAFTTAFFNTIKQYIEGIFPNVNLDLTMKEFIFGIRNENIYSETNFVILHIRYYIWVTRCNKKIPDYTCFINWFKNELRVKKKCYEYSGQLSFLMNLNV